jgi:putative ABC transport system permease protein
MRAFREWIARLLQPLRQGRRDAELEEELQLHLELAAEDARRRGVPSDEALRAARIRLGGVPQALEALRDQRGTPFVTGLGQDLRLAARSLRSAPGVTGVAIVSLALAIGANTAIFSIVDSLVLRALPVRDPVRLVHVTDTVVTEDGTTRVRAWSNPVWEQIRDRSGFFEALTAWSFTRFDRSSGGETQFVDGLWADGGFFETLGVPAVVGRTFSDEDDRRGGGPDGPVAVISYAYWRRQWGAARDVIGQQVRLEDVTFTIVGVTPPEFHGPEVGRSFDVIAPLRTEALIRRRDSALDSASTNFLTIMARLKQGQSLDAATAALRGIQPHVREATLEPWDTQVAERFLTAPFTAVPAATGYSTLRRSYERPLLIIEAVVALVLMIGCVNVANLLLARAAARRHELSVQVALGASRWRLARQLFAESSVLAAAGAALGVFVAAYGSRFLVRQLSTPTAVVFLDVSLNGRVIAFLAAVTAVTVLLFGTAPAFRATRANPVDALKEQGRASAEQAHSGLMGRVIVVQVALSMVLLVAAGLFIRSFNLVANRPLGLQPEQVLVVALDPQRAMVPPEHRVALYERVREAVLRLPDVSHAAISHLTPVGGGGFTPAVEIAGTGTTTLVDANRDLFGNLISPGWFETFGTRLVAGRDFTDGDRTGALRVAIVNESFVRRFLDGASPLGRVMTVYPNSPRALRMEIVGVATDAIYSSPRFAVPPTWYAPLAQFDVPGFPFSRMRLSVRATTDAPAHLTKTIASAVAEMNPRLALTFRTLSNQIDTSLARERLMALLAGFFGVLALLLAGLGLYGVTAHATSRRRTEIGIRLALGATPARVIRLVLARVSVLVGAGIAAGAALSLWASRFAAGLIYDVAPRDPATLIGAALVLLAAAAVAAWVPARRAVHIDPSAVIRGS